MQSNKTASDLVKEILWKGDKTLESDENPQGPPSDGHAGTLCPRRNTLGLST
jgi:hypothetical protein